jgi:hypothetical protein
MDASKGNISDVLSTPKIQKWRDKGKRHMYFWVFFHTAKNSTLHEELVEDRRLEKIFTALEVLDEGNTMSVRSPVVLITDAQGFHDILTHLDKRKKMHKRRVWLWQVVHYIPASNHGFPPPDVVSSNNVYCVLCFGHSPDQKPQ